MDHRALRRRLGGPQARRWLHARAPQRPEAGPRAGRVASRQRHHHVQPARPHRCRHPRLDHRSGAQPIRRRRRSASHRLTSLSDHPAPTTRWKLVAVVGALVLAVVVGLVVALVSTSHDSTTGPLAGNVVSGGDLGPVDGDLALRAKLEPVFAASGTRPTGTQQIRRSPCEATARKLQPHGAPLAYVAMTSWQGTPAEVFGFNPPGARATSPRGRPTPTR